MDNYKSTLLFFSFHSPFTFSLREPCSSSHKYNYPRKDRLFLRLLRVLFKYSMYLELIYIRFVHFCEKSFSKKLQCSFEREGWTTSLIFEREMDSGYNIHTTQIRMERGGRSSIPLERRRTLEINTSPPEKFIRSDCGGIKAQIHGNLSYCASCIPTVRLCQFIQILRKKRFSHSDKEQTGFWNSAFL